MNALILALSLAASPPVLCADEQAFLEAARRDAAELRRLRELAEETAALTNLALCSREAAALRTDPEELCARRARELAELRRR